MLHRIRQSLIRLLGGPVVEVRDGDVLDLSGSRGVFRAGIRQEEGGEVVMPHRPTWWPSINGHDWG